jgi:hypothetical protein
MLSAAERLLALVGRDDELHAEAVRGLQALDLLGVAGSMMSRGELGPLVAPGREAARRVEVMAEILALVALEHPAERSGALGD